MKAGAIVPFSNQEEGDNSIDNPNNLEIRIFPAANGEFTLWEDQGDTVEDLDENWASTKMILNDSTFVIEKAIGNLEVIPERRSWKLVFVATEKNRAEVLVDGKTVDIKEYYDDEKQSVVIEISGIDVTKSITVKFESDLKVAEERKWEPCNKILERAQASYEFKARAIYAIENQGKNAISTLRTFNLDRSILEALIEVLTARNTKK